MRLSKLNDVLCKYYFTIIFIIKSTHLDLSFLMKIVDIMVIRSCIIMEVEIYK